MSKSPAPLALIVWLASASAATGCGTDEQTSGHPPNALPFETIQQGIHSGLTEPFNVAFTSGQGWAAYHAQLHANESAPPAPPAVDFGAKIVVGVGLGNRPDSGHRTTITRIGWEAPPSERLLISYVENRSGYGCGVDDVTTQPFHLVSLDRDGVDGETEFRFRLAEQVTDCETPPSPTPCQQKDTAIRQELARINRCESKTDCQVLADRQCLPGCFALKHENESTDTLSHLLASRLADLSCGQCVAPCETPPPAATTLGCIGGRCEVITIGWQ